MGKTIKDEEIMNKLGLYRIVAMYESQLRNKTVIHHNSAIFDMDTSIGEIVHWYWESGGFGSQGDLKIIAPIRGNVDESQK